MTARFRFAILALRVAWKAFNESRSRKSLAHRICKFLRRLPPTKMIHAWMVLNCSENLQKSIIALIKFRQRELRSPSNIKLELLLKEEKNFNAVTPSRALQVRHKFWNNILCRTKYRSRLRMAEQYKLMFRMRQDLAVLNLEIILWWTRQKLWMVIMIIYQTKFLLRS